MEGDASEIRMNLGEVFDICTINKWINKLKISEARAWGRPQSWHAWPLPCTATESKNKSLRNKK